MPGCDGSPPAAGGASAPCRRPRSTVRWGRTGNERTEAYEKLCADLGEDAAKIALAWLLHQDGVTVPIMGPRAMAQLDSSVRAVEVALEARTLARLDELFPSPGPNGAKSAPRGLRL